MKLTHILSLCAALCAAAMAPVAMAEQPTEYLHYGALSHHFGGHEDDPLDYHETHACLGYETSEWQASWCEDSLEKNTWFVAKNWNWDLGYVGPAKVGFQMAAGILSKHYLVAGWKDSYRRLWLAPIPAVTAQVGNLRTTIVVKPRFNKYEPHVVIVRFSIPL